MNTEQARELLQRYRMGLCTEAEESVVEKWFASLADSGQWEWTASEKEAFQQMLQMKIANKIGEVNTIPAFRRKRFRLLYFAAAAAVILLVGTGVYRLFYVDGQKKAVLAQKTNPPLKNEVQPGISGAILTIANGEKIVLDSTGNGTLAIQSDVKVINRGGQLIYDFKSGNPAKSNPSEIVYNTITTPRAKQFQLRLSDGTRVWLNAASSVRFPARFEQGNRTVEVSGEVYFEVASLPGDNRNEKIPFLVKIVSATGADGGTVEVTGTHFNINAYEDEALIKTTLIEGRIKFKKGSSERSLIPGQQAQLNKNGIVRILKNANVETEIAWKNGYFTYDRTDIQTVMKQISRWYDIEVDYESGRVPDDKYWGDIQRDASLSTVLKVLEMSGVRFRVEGRKVTVIKGIRG